MRHPYYILEGHDVRAVDVATFDAWYSAHPGPQRAVAQDTLPDGRWLSTVFLGFDHGIGGEPPLVFETMLFRSERDLDDFYCQRYATWDEAAAAHRAILGRLREGLSPNADDPA